MLRITAEHADIAAFTGARAPAGNAGGLEPLTGDELQERVATYRKFAADRAESAELNLLVQMVAVTDDRPAAVRPLLEHLPQLTEEQALDSRCCSSAPSSRSPSNCWSAASGSGFRTSPSWSRPWRRSRR